MPTPDPNGLYIDEDENGRITITAEIWPHGNRRHRIARMKRVMRNVRTNRWRCWGCGGLMPLYKRADAKFCKERCRR
jgi:hypothetical protein